MTRDQAAEWMEGMDVGPALRLWRALSRRCVGPYTEHAAALLTLTGWVCLVGGGDGATAREPSDSALPTDPDYPFAQLLQRGINEGLDPEPLRRCLREQHTEAVAAAGAFHRSGRRGDTAAHETPWADPPRTRRPPPGAARRRRPSHPHDRRAQQAPDGPGRRPEPAVRYRPAPACQACPWSGGPPGSARRPSSRRAPGGQSRRSPWPA